MIGLSLIGNNFKYETENIIMIFFPDQKIRENERGDFMNIAADSSGADLCVSIEYNNKIYSDKCEKSGNDELSLCRMIFLILSEITGIKPDWGMLTGVRPTKLLRTLIVKHGLSKALDIMRNEMLVSNHKLTLAYQTMRIQDSLLDSFDPMGYNLYVSIPFCKSRCSYCSFISHDVAHSAKLIPEYVELLCKEIEHTMALANSLGLKLQTVYFGGGTPTALDDGMLSLIDKAIRKNADTSSLREYTVEAGRPDTITAKKLREIKAMGANRISINPQTLSDETLKRIGRAHTVGQFYNSFSIARSLGFNNINTDLIAGLAGENEQDFERTLDRIIDLAPECITVHTLSVKRSASATESGEAQFNARRSDVDKMIEYSREKMYDSGYFPYYMYRQSRQTGNLENVGWSMPHFEGLYNMLIMEELQTVVAVGAGASSKAVGAGDIKRVFNYKYPYEYISGFNEILNRKDKFFGIISEQLNG